MGTTYIDYWPSESLINPDIQQPDTDAPLSDVYNNLFDAWWRRHASAIGLISQSDYDG